MQETLSPMRLAEFATYYLIAMNLIAFIAFGLDKARAENGSWRISEGTLLMWAFLGGSIGAYAGRSAFRHKTRKQPFCTMLHSIAFMHLMLVGLLLSAIWAGLGDRVHWGAEDGQSFASAYGN